jgi:hypothetical protein
MKSNFILFIGIVFLLFSCSDDSNKSFESINYNPSKDQLFKIGMSTNSIHTPLQFLPVWNYATVEKLKIKKITVFSFGGKSPTDTLQKNIFSFDWKTYKTNFTEKGITPTGEYKSIGKYKVLNNNHTEIDLRIIDEDKKEKNFKTIIKQKGPIRMILKQKVNAKIDTTFIHTIDKNHKVSIFKIGDNVQGIQFIVPQNTKTSELKRIVSKLNLRKELITSSTLSVIYTKNGLPIEAYNLNDEFVQFSKEKEWFYTKNKCVEKYIEYYNNSVVKTVTFKYSKNFLPKKMIVNNIHYHFEYQID